ncbi:MAG TPA: hypothetical protein H9884_10260 [Candidatus Yaniella excrementigallinarum]|nr:hypothetical protein [Candidatus Yaniella excrementigallinarum]
MAHPGTLRFGELGLIDTLVILWLGRLGIGLVMVGNDDFSFSTTPEILLYNPIVPPNQSMATFRLE